MRSCAAPTPSAQTSPPFSLSCCFHAVRRRSLCPTAFDWTVREQARKATAGGGQWLPTEGRFDLVRRVRCTVPAAEAFLSPQGTIPPTHSVTLDMLLGSVTTVPLATSNSSLRNPACAFALAHSRLRIRACTLALARSRLHARACTLALARSRLHARACTLALARSRLHARACASPLAQPLSTTRSQAHACNRQSSRAVSTA
jgi:hypothetical protein